MRSQSGAGAIQCGPGSRVVPVRHAATFKLVHCCGLRSMDSAPWKAALEGHRRSERGMVIRAAAIRPPLRRNSRPGSCFGLVGNCEDRSECATPTRLARLNRVVPARWSVDLPWRRTGERQKNLSRRPGPQLVGTAADSVHGNTASDVLVRSPASNCACSRSGRSRRQVRQARQSLRTHVDEAGLVAGSTLRVTKAARVI